MKVSIVVPLYNNEAYIGRCIDSILHQNHKNFEIIIVDDGSTDGSLTLCRSFESETIRVFTKPNGGPASARNFGIQHCSSNSEYITFVDSDDTVEPNYLSSMLTQAAPDTMVICGINNYYDNNIANSLIEVKSGEKYIFNDIWSNRDFLRELRRGIINSSCNKCYSLETIRRYNILFGKAYPEDTRFNLAYLEHCDIVCLLSDNLYNYIHRLGSVTSKPAESIYTEYMKIQEYLQRKVPKEYYQDIMEFVYPQYLGTTLRFLQAGDCKTPKHYIRQKLVRDSVKAHKPTCKGDALMKYLLQLGWLNLLKCI